MPDNLILEWINENSLRAYPLMAAGSPIFVLRGITFNAFEMVVDANFVYGTLPNSIKLSSIAISGSTATFGVTGQPSFSVNLSSTFPAYIRNSVGSLLVLGRATATLLGQSTTVVFTDLVFEPTVSIEQSNELLGVSSITLDTDTLTNAISIVDGYQFSAVPTGQTIQIEANRNEGIPLPCGNFKGTTNDCNSIVSNVNGAAPVNDGEPITILAGNHVKVFDDPDNHRVYIGLDFTATDACTVPSLLPN